MQKTKYYSYKIGALPKGCQLCVKGSKLVLFITGLCNRACYFCPISDKKYKKDVTYADEWPITNISQIIKEAESIKAKGAGFTGGDPLCRLRRTLFYLRKLKNRFGNKFHAHLYTSLNLINKNNLKKLYKAGLDEIRFHPDLDNNQLWNKIKLALEHSWDVGIEIPVIPEKEEETKNLIIFINKINKNRIKFLNLNELEIADNKVNKLSNLGYKTKNQLSYAVKGSEELALKLLKFIKKNKIKLNVHYCTAKLKDRIQLANRIKRRAKNIARPYDTVNKEGILIRGAIYLKELSPGFNYRKRLERIRNKKQIIKKLNEISKSLIKKHKISKKLIDVDKNKLRILTHPKILIKIKPEKNLAYAIVEEYPTYDQMEVSVDFL